jgi:hypothetical protein
MADFSAADLRGARFDRGWPRPRSYPVRECLLIVLNEEWCHRQFAERDLAALESRAAQR